MLAPVLARVFSLGFLLELAAIAGTGLIAYWVAPRLVRFLTLHISPRRQMAIVASIAAIAASVAVPALWLLFLWLAVEAATAGGLETGFASSGVALLAAWVVIRLLSHVVRSPLWSRIIFVGAWSIAALQIFGLLGRIEASLSNVGINYGEVRISALNVVRALIVLVVLLWLSGRLRGFLEQRILLTQSSRIARHSGFGCAAGAWHQPHRHYGLWWRSGSRHRIGPSKNRGESGERRFDTRERFDPAGRRYRRQGQGGRRCFWPGHVHQRELPFAADARRQGTSHPQ